MPTTEDLEMSQVYFAKTENWSINEIAKITNHAQNIRFRGMEKTVEAWTEAEAMAYYVNELDLIKFVQELAVTDTAGKVTIRAQKPISIAKADSGMFLAEGFRRFMALKYAASMPQQKDPDGNIFYTLRDLKDNPVQEKDSLPFVFNEVYQVLLAQIIRPEIANNLSAVTRLQVQLDSSQKKLTTLAKMRAIYDRFLSLQDQVSAEFPDLKGNFLVSKVQDLLVREFVNDRGQPIGKQTVTDAKYLFESVPEELHDLFAYGAISSLDCLKIASQKYSSICEKYPEKLSLDAWIAAMHKELKGDPDEKITKRVLKLAESTVLTKLEEEAQRPNVLKGLPKSVLSAVEDETLKIADTQMLKEKATEAELDPAKVLERAKAIAFSKVDTPEGEPLPNPETDLVEIDARSIREAVRELKNEKKTGEPVVPLSVEELIGWIHSVKDAVLGIEVDSLDEKALKAIGTLAKATCEKIAKEKEAQITREEKAQVTANLEDASAMLDGLEDRLGENEDEDEEDEDYDPEFDEDEEDED